MSHRHPYAVSDADVLEALRDAAANEPHDLAEGGVVAEQIAKYCDLKPNSLGARLRELDQVVQVRGLNRETYVPRVSWLPAEEVSDGFDD